MNTPISIFDEAADYLRSRTTLRPTTAIILGSGLGKLADAITDADVIPYADIPHFKQSTAVGHKGNLIVGMLNGQAVMAMQGRFHYYEGYTMQEVTLPVRVMSRFGIRRLLVSNAAGGINPSFKVGDLMIITDHINFMPNPLVGKNIDEMGVRFPDMTTVYSRPLRQRAHEAAHRLGLQLQEGVYVAETGPTYETPAEYRMFGMLGGDAVGMSTVPEVIVARHCGMEIFGMSVITNCAKNLSDDCTNDGNDVVRAADNAADNMTEIFKALIV
jgi:purine-nucleoside phosphorylase